MAEENTRGLGFTWEGRDAERKEGGRGGRGGGGGGRMGARDVDITGWGSFEAPYKPGQL